MIKFLTLFVMHELVDFLVSSWMHEGEYIATPIIKMTGIQII